MTSLCCLIAYGQKGLTVDQGAFSSSIGGITTVIPGGDAIFNNFSMITGFDNFSLISGQSKANILISTAQKYSLSELTSVSFGFHLPVRSLGHMGLELSNYGFESYSEQLIRLKYAMSLGSNLAISGTLGMHNLRIEDYGTQANIVFELALSGKISKDLIYGIQISNPEKISIDDNSVLISRLAFGLAYKVSNKVKLFGELDKELEEEFNFKVGLDYKLHPKFHIRTGYSTLPGQVTSGFKWYIMHNLGLETAFLYNSLLGITPVLTLSYQLSQNED